MKDIFKGAIESVQGTRERLFYRVMWYIITVAVVVWSVLAGLQLVVNCSIIEHNSESVSKSNTAVSVKEVKDGYLYLQNEEKVKESEITEYIKTKPGMLPRYMGKGVATQPISEVGIVQYAIKFFSLVLTSFVCMAVCNWFAGVLARWKRVMLRFFYVLLLLCYGIVYVMYFGMFTYVDTIQVYYAIGAMAVVTLIVFNSCLFSIKLEYEEDEDVCEE